MKHQVHATSDEMILVTNLSPALYTFSPFALSSACFGRGRGLALTVAKTAPMTMTANMESFILSPTGEKAVKLLFIPRPDQLYYDIGPRLHLFPRDPGKDAVQGPQNCPRNSSEAKSSEDSFDVRGLHLYQRSQGKRWSLIIIPWFCCFTTRTGVS